MVLFFVNFYHMLRVDADKNLQFDKAVGFKAIYNRFHTNSYSTPYSSIRH